MTKTGFLSDRGPGFQNPLIRRGLDNSILAWSAVWSIPTLEQAKQLEASTSLDRLHRYRAVMGGRRNEALTLYIVDAELASQFHAHLRWVEVILREQIHRALTQTYSSQWYISHASLLGGHARSMLSEAKGSLGDAKFQRPGYVVAEVMLGFWTNLLQNPASGDHERIWREALAAVFNQRRDVAAWNRHDAMQLVQRLNWARNRVNHCESVVFGFPQKGVRPNGKQLRLPPEMILDDCRRLIGRFGSDLHAWISSSSATDALLARSDVQAAWTSVAGKPNTSTPASAPAKYWKIP